MFDIEVSQKNEVVLIGTFDGDTYQDYYSKNCIEDFVSKLDCNYLVGFNMINM